MRLWPRRNPKKWDLVLTDVNRPQMDGVSLVRALRALPECKCTPILVLTTEAGDATPGWLAVLYSMTRDSGGCSPARERVQQQYRG